MFFNVVVAANMYSEMREEARDHARVRNVYFEQVCLFVFWKVENGVEWEY